MCFTAEWLEHIFILVVVICAVVALIRLLISFVLPQIGLGGKIVDFIVRAAWIIMWAVICITAIIFIFELVACLLPYASSGRLR